MKGFYGYEEKRIERIKPTVEIPPELERKIKRKTDKVKRNGNKQSERR
jgi:hypothetical protein